MAPSESASEFASVLTVPSLQAAKKVSDNRTVETFEQNLEFAFIFINIIYSLTISFWQVILS